MNVSRGQRRLLRGWGLHKVSPEMKGVTVCGKLDSMAYSNIQYSIFNSRISHNYRVSHVSHGASVKFCCGAESAETPKLCHNEATWIVYGDAGDVQGPSCSYEGQLLQNCTSM